MLEILVVRIYTMKYDFNINKVITIEDYIHEYRTKNCLYLVLSTVAVFYMFKLVTFHFLYINNYLLIRTKNICAVFKQHATKHCLKILNIGQKIRFKRKT